MAITKDQTEEIIKKIEDAIKKTSGETKFKCPVCTNNQFSLAGGFTKDSIMDNVEGGLVLGGPVLPSIPIICTNCGNTFFLNAKILGISTDKETKNKKDEKS